MQPRGIRNNNPGNIRWGENWQGLDPKGKEKDKSFCIFIDAKWGLRALCRILMNYYRRYELSTIREIINRYAPPNENNTTSYIQNVCKSLDVKDDDKIDVLNSRTMAILMKAIIRMENGVQPYSDAQIKAAIYEAGIC